MFFALEEVSKLKLWGHFFIVIVVVFVVRIHFCRWDSFLSLLVCEKKYTVSYRCPNIANLAISPKGDEKYEDTRNCHYSRCTTNSWRLVSMNLLLLEVTSMYLVTWIVDWKLAFRYGLISFANVYNWVNNAGVWQKDGLVFKSTKVNWCMSILLNLYFHVIVLLD